MAVKTIDLGRVVGPQGPQGEYAAVDPYPVQSSENPVSSGGVYNALSIKEYIIQGGASSITQADLIANRALVSSNRGKVAVSSVTDEQLAILSRIGTVVSGKMEGTIDAFAAQTHAISIDIPTQNGAGGTWIITGWLEINKPPMAGRYGAQIHEEPYGGEEKIVMGTQNYYEYTTGGSTNKIGWNIAHIAVVEGMSPVKYYLNLLASPASESNTVRITRAELKAVRIV